jgi:hypothetical protein
MDQPPIPKPPLSPPMPPLPPKPAALLVQKEPPAPAVLPEPRPSFIENLQLLDEPMKQRVLIAGSALLMLVVVYVWAGYFNNIVMSNPVQLADQNAIAAQAQQQQAQQAPAAQTAQSQSNTPGFWQEFGSGAVSLYNNAVNGIKNIGIMLRNPKQYTVTPQQ